MNNDLEQFSEERLKEIADFAMAGAIEVVELARIALAAKQAKPVGYVLCNHGNPDIDFVFADEDSAIGTSEHLNDDADGKDEWTVMPFYTTPQPAHTEQVIPEWTNGQCLEFLQVAFRHNTIDGEIEFDDIRLGVKFALAAAPKPESER